MTESTVSSDLSYQSRDLVESFLQNVVVLDDLAVMSEMHHEHPDGGAVGQLSSPHYPELPAARNDPVRVTQRGARLDADAVIKAFADIGSVCAVLNPVPGDAFQERIAKAAIRADIVVLDWKIHHSVGDATLSIVRSILQSDQNGHRLRLIAIYTGEPNLARISERTQEVIDEFYDDEVLEIDELLRISKGPVRVVVLAKEGVTNDRTLERQAQEVTEVDLARRLVDEFALMNSGLLRSLALAGIASVRNKAHQVLMRFDRSLDAAYLGHRLLLHHPPVAEDQVVAALGAELLSVLEADRPGLYADISAIRQWLSDKQLEKFNHDEAMEATQKAVQREDIDRQEEDNVVDLNAPLGFREDSNLVEAWSELLLRGVDADGVTLPTEGKAPLKRKSTEAFAHSSDAAMRSNQDFAALLSLKMRYTEERPRLTLGTILQDLSREPDTFLICLQPKCDSTRLKSDVGFPFLPLESVSTLTTNVAFDLVVEIQDGRWEHLAIDTRPSRLVARSFSPLRDEADEILPPGEVLAEGDPTNGFVFSDTEGINYRWISEIKDEHALRVTGEVASALARPGPDDSEWLRRASQIPRKRPN